MVAGVSMRLSVIVHTATVKYEELSPTVKRVPNVQRACSNTPSHQPSVKNYSQTDSLCLKRKSLSHPTSPALSPPHPLV